MANALRSPPPQAAALSSNSPKPISTTALLPSLRFVAFASQHHHHHQQGETDTLDAQDLEEEEEVARASAFSLGLVYGSMKLKKDLYASFPCHFPSSRFPIQTHKPAAWIHPRNHHAALLGGIRCMAKPRRVAMVAKQIQRELSDMLLTDKVLQYAILPEVSLGADRYLSSLTTISDVEVSTDLQVVKVFVSVFGDERGKEVALAGLKSKAKYVRGELGRRMKLRLTPEIRFIEDESLERGSRVIAILDRIKNDKKDGQMQDEEQLESSDSLQDDKDWEDDDPDEDIVYIK